ncbi:hypothetical protein SNOG_20183 [Parastagonospora nodorum SN15]|uniref:Uncharacterized protein n=1 Tax=Phaeosphaeria nodorum (strain SN15 / ATCC MYA-4574 / FGSC 10173) TaxID=321614 RepID=A9JXH8_PHANO|nr:hypothetical protein SNOG_20183 [Parastagonospora nodorum SN15]EDP89884.1 hypothetical protein SNOG_20183 [Parastagonospora nodorum SN15]
MPTEEDRQRLPDIHKVKRMVEAFKSSEVLPVVWADRVAVVKRYMPMKARRNMMVRVSHRNRIVFQKRRGLVLHAQKPRMNTIQPNVDEAVVA